MPKYTVEWIERHIKTVEAENSDKAIEIAREDQLKSCVTSELRRIHDAE